MKIAGTGSLRGGGGAGGGGGQDEDDGAPKIEAVPARLYSRMGWVLGLTFGLLGVGGTLLYRRGAA